MASSFALTVLLPNAKRVNVKVTPNTSILQVLEDVCTKQGLNPIEWDLTHHDRVVELGNSLRYTGIPNNGTLEMVQSTKTRKESTINLGLQLESGKRLMNPFFPHQTLWEVLDHWAKKGEPVFPPDANNAEGVQPVCIYMRQEVIGQEQLEKKTLRALGLTQGSAMIRLIHRSAGQLKHQANVSAPLSRVSIPVEEKPYSRKLPAQSAPTERKNSCEEDKPKTEMGQGHRLNDEPMDLSLSDGHSSSQSIVPPQPLSTNTSASSSSTSQASQVEPSASIAEQHPVPLINNAMRYSKQGDLHILGDRDALVYHGDDVVVQSGTDSLTDDFFEVTITDVKKMFRSLQEKRKELEETPLQIQAARELEKDTTMLRLLHDHPTTVVRIRFANRYVLQGTFRTADTIETICTWLKQFLANPELSFYLFTTPPKKILEVGTRLVEEELVGMAVIYFGSADPSSPADQAVLKPDIYSKVSAPDAVFDFIHKKIRKEKLQILNGGGEVDNSSDIRMEDGQIPSSSSSVVGGAGSSEDPKRSPRPAQVQPRSAEASGGGNVPKWFKLRK